MVKPLTLTQLEHLLFQRFEEGFLSLRDLPQPSQFKDMDRATERIVSAIRNQEKITIIGDYDVDGVTSTTLMKLFFDEIDTPIEWIIPNRFRDGYGLSANIIPRIVGTDLAVTSKAPNTPKRAMTAARNILRKSANEWKPNVAKITTTEKIKSRLPKRIKSSR